jgi:hypothetical protein
LYLCHVAVACWIGDAELKVSERGEPALLVAPLVIPLIGQPAVQLAGRPDNVGCRRRRPAAIRPEAGHPKLVCPARRIRSWDIRLAHSRNGRR